MVGNWEGKRNYLGLNSMIGFWFRLICGVCCLSLVGMMFYHGNTDKYFIWGFLTLLGVAWLLGAYWRYPKRRK